MNKKLFITLVICLFGFTAAFILINGNRYTESYKMSDWGFDPDSYDAEDFYVYAEDPGIIEISSFRIEDGKLKADLKALERGSTYLFAGLISEREGTESRRIIQRVYVHRFNIITLNSYLGDCTGDFLIPVCILVILLFLYYDRLKKYRIEVKENLYSYRNIMNLGLLIFMTFLILDQLSILPGFHGIDNGVRSVLSSAESFAYIAFPIAIILSVMITISNLSLMRREGANWRNLLGFILGVGLCLMTVLPGYVYTFLLKHQIVDIFNEKGIGTYVFSAFEHLVFFMITYFECIMAGTVAFGIKAARHIPSFDKDYILILGSQIRPDGTLTPLLKGRADRAVEFAQMQKEASGKDIVFIPSGGKGSDEIIPEADAIGSYLLEKGLPKDRILIENRSVNTEENIRNSMKLIEDDFTDRDHTNGEPKAAFSTTNYHVFRAGLIASELGYRMEGIGSPTKSYFWINAFIREFVATMVSERKRHLKVILLIFIGLVIMTAFRYLSVLM